jgi:hypothetical protein
LKRQLAGVATALMLSAASGANAQSEIFSPDTLHGIADLRLSAAATDRDWLDGGFGKTGRSDGLDAGLAEAALEWRPRFSFGLSGYVTAELQPDVDPALDLGEAYLSYRGPPSAAGRWSARAGVFWPPVSMEHDGTAWTTPDMLSASAINSWIGEEVKVAGLEGAYQVLLGEHEVTAKAAVFGWNDTSGTLLSFRGWALHGVKTGVATGFDLPPLSPFMQTKQAGVTDPYYELDGRAGYYGALEWRPPAPFSFNALYYDNVGDRISVEGKQWAWETRFLNLGMRWEPTEGLRVLAQAVNGETLMGYRMPGGIWIDMGFHAAYVLAQREVGEDMLSGRIDWFETNDRTYREIDNNDEQGWAFTAAWRRTLSKHAAVIMEAQHVTSERPSRVLAGDAARQGETVLQTALRLSF